MVSRFDVTFSLVLHIYRGSAWRSEQVLLPVGLGIRRLAPVRGCRRGKGAHQPQCALLAVKNLVEILAPRATAADGAWPVRGGIKRGMAWTFASPFHRSDLQHLQLMI